MTIYKFGQIVLIGFPHTNLRNISKRPAIVLYDAGDRDILVARITTQKYSTESDYTIQSWRKCGLIAESCIRLGKMATIEKRYILKDIGILLEAEAQALKAILKRVFDF